MKKRIIAALLACMLLLMGGCGNTAKPEDTVENFFKAAQTLDLEAMITTIEPSNTEDINDTKALFDEDEFDDYTKYFLDYLKENAGKMTYTIGKSEVDGDKAVVTVDCKYVDGGPLLSATIGEVFKKTFELAFSGTEMTDEEMVQMFTGIMEEQRSVVEETFKESTLDINCVKQDGKWYISEMEDELLDVAMSGFLSAGEKMSEAFSED